MPFSFLFLTLVLSLGVSMRVHESRTMPTSVGIREQSRFNNVACDVSGGMDQLQMSLVPSSGIWKPSIEVVNVTQTLTFELGNGVEEWNGNLASGCLTHCTVLDYSNLPPKKKHWQKSCQNSFAQAFGTDASDTVGNALVDRAKKISKIYSADRKELYKLCCVFESLSPQIEKQGLAEATTASSTSIRSISWESDEFAVYGVFESSSVASLFLSALHGLMQIWKNSGEQAYMAKMREVWQEADRVGESSATLLVTCKNPWKVHVWWVGDSKAKVLNGEASTESHLCKQEMGSKLKSHALKSVYSPFGWMCCIGKSCTRLSRSLGGSAHWPDISGEPEFADWTSMATAGSVVAIASHTVWDYPLNDILVAHWSEIYKAYKGGKTTDNIAVVAAANWKRRFHPLAEVSTLQKLRDEKEVDFIEAPLIQAAQRGTLQRSLLSRIVKRAQGLKSQLDGLQGKRPERIDVSALVVVL